MSATHSTLAKYGVTLHLDMILRQAAIRYNHGRARKVSFKRPSPQMSRARLELVKARAVLEATMGAGDE